MNLESETTENLERELAFRKEVLKTIPEQLENVDLTKLREAVKESFEYFSLYGISLSNYDKLLFKTFYGEDIKILKRGY